MVLQRALVCPVVIGREAEIEELLGLVSHAAEGRGGLALISGEPGIGKSRLVAEIATSAANRGFDVIRGAAYQGDEAVPYAPLIDALTASGALGGFKELLVAAVDGRVPDASYGNGAAARRLTFERLYERCVELTAGRPTLLVVDDLHWADATTLAFLQLVASRLRMKPLLVLATTRDAEGEAGPEFLAWVAELDRRRLLQIVPLSPLSADDVERMVETTLGAPATPSAMKRVHALAGGNPFYIEELLREMTSDRGGDGSGLPVRLRDVLLARLSGMSADAWLVAEAAAVIGRRFDTSLISAIVDAPPETVAQATDELVRWQVIEAAPHSVGGRQFRHALVHQAFADSLPAERRRELHRAIAGEMAGHFGGASTVADAGELGKHWFEAGEPSLARSAFVAAGHAASAIYAFDEAREQYERALALSPAVASHEQYDLLVNHARTAALTGRIAAAIADYETAAELAAELGAPDLEGEALRLLGRQHSFSGRGKEAIRCLRRAVELLEPFPQKLGWAQAYLGQALMMEEDEAEAATWAGMALEHSAHFGDRGLRAHALDTLGVCKRQTEGYATGLELVSQAIEEAEAAGESEEMARACNNYVHMLIHAGAPLPQIVAALDRCLATMERFGYFTFAAFTAASLSKFMICAGEWDRAKALLGRSEDTATDGHRLTAYNASLARGLLAYYRGDWREALAHLRAAAGALSESAAMDPHAMTVSYLSRTQRLASVAGEAESLTEQLLNAAIARGSVAHLPSLLRERVIQLIERGAIDEAVAVAGRLHEVPERSAVFQREFAILLSDGALALAKNDIAEASRLYGDAAALAVRFDMPLLAAEALTECGTALVRRRGNVDRGHGEDMLDRARAIFATYGSDFVDRYLAASGVQSANARSTPPELRVLSARELEVFACLGQGKSNRQIAEELVLSERTVERHLSNIYAKLSVEGRSAAVAMAARLGIESPR